MIDGNGHGERLSRCFEQAIAALLETSTLREAAGQVGVAESTLKRWLSEPEFAAAYQQARRQVLEAALASLSGAAGKAVQTLVRILDGDSPNAAVRAAGLILDHAERGAELLDLNARLEQLEALLPRTDEGERQRGAPPKNVKDRIGRLEGRAPFGCIICVNRDNLAEALRDVEQPWDGLCPRCGGAPPGEVALGAMLLSVRPGGAN